MTIIKTTTDGAMGAIGMVSLVGALPEILAAIASLMSIIWFAIRFYNYFKKKKDIEE